MANINTSLGYQILIGARGLEAFLDHGAIQGLGGDDHTQYVLVTDLEADRATINTYWEDLTDGGATALHTHAGGGAGDLLADGSIPMTADWPFGNFALYIGDTVNTKMTIGLTINQAGNDDEILCFKSSDVSHGMTDVLEDDTFFAALKMQANGGGVRLLGIIDSDEPAKPALEIRGLVEGNADTTKALTARGVIESYSTQTDGAGYGNMVAGGNIVVFRSRYNGSSQARWVLDTHGNTWQPGKLGIGVAPSYCLDVYADVNDWAVRIDQDDVTGYGLLIDLDSSDIGDWVASFRAGAKTNLFNVMASGIILIGETSNTNMTQGLTINQGANDDEILALKSSDVTHGVTDFAETDTYATFRKAVAAEGGLEIMAIGAKTNDLRSVFELRAFGGDPNNSMSSSKVGYFNLLAADVSGVALADVSSNEVLLSIRAYKSSSFATVWALDEDGDTWQSGDITIEHAAGLASQTPLSLIFEDTQSGTFTLDAFRMKIEFKSADASGSWDGGETRSMIAEVAASTFGSESALVFHTSSVDAVLTERLRIAAVGGIFINDSENTAMTIGLTINQSTNDNEILALKSTDVDHGGVEGEGNNNVEDNTFGTFRKVNASAGGLHVAGWRDSSGSAAAGIVLQGSLSENVASTKNTASGALVEARGQLLSGAGAAADVNASGNIFCVKARKSGAFATVFIVDEDGDTWQLASQYMVNAKYIYYRNAADTEDYRALGCTTGDLLLIGSSDFSGVKFANNIVLIGTDANTHMSIGLTIDQAANDDEAFAIQSNKVIHGLETIANTETYFSIRKTSAGQGGARIRAIAEDAATEEVLVFQSFGGTANTTKSTAGLGLVNVVVYEHDGNDSLANITANGNVFSIRALTGGSVATKWILDEEGDTWQTGAATIVGGAVIGKDAAPILALDVYGTPAVVDDARLNVILVDKTSIAAGVGAGLSFAGVYTDAGGITSFGAVWATKFNAVSENTAGLLHFSARDSGGHLYSRLMIDQFGGVYINDTLNTFMTIGLTINQAANDNEILAFKSSDVAHGMIGEAETDTFMSMQKRIAAWGGVKITAIAANEAMARVLQFNALGGTALTAKSTGGTGLVNYYIAEHDGSNAKANITADGCVYGITAYVGSAWRTLWLLDEDGDYHYDGADGGAFDDYEDAQLVRAFSLATSKDVIRTQWDEAVQYNEASLIEAGILGDTVANGGLVNGAQLQRLHNGAIWQLHQKIETQALQIESLESKLKLLEM